MAGSSVESPSIISGRDPIAYSTSNPLPTVISEIIGGIILGPTVLSRWTAFRTHVFPEQSLVNLNLVANFGLVLFLFMVGLELDPRVLKRNIKQCIMISVAGMALPFALGIASSYALYHVLMDGHGEFHIFLLFLGVAMAITAFPVLGRILTELNLLKTVVGSTTISSAAIDDVTSWCLLALVIALTNNTSGLTALWALLVGLGWTLFVFFAVKPAYLWYLRRNGCLKGRDPSQTVLFVTFMMVFISAFFTDIIGIHAIFGGFIVGVIVPHDGGFAIKVTEKIEDVVQIFFLPIYFTLSGLKTNLSSLDDGKTWGLLVLVCVVAFVGKTAGCTVAARLSKFTWRESLTIGILMDCKGLVELIVLNIGLQAGVIDTRVFSMMVVMALVTTFITAPAVKFLYPPKYQRRLEEPGADIGDAQSAITKRHGPEAGPPVRMLVVLSRLPQVPAIMTLLGYLHHQPELSSSRRLISQHTNNDTQALVSIRTKQNYRPIRVFGLRLLEATGRDSSIMQQYEADARVSTDPVMSMFRAFARVANMMFHASLSYSDREHFVDTVLASARDANAEMTIVSAFGRDSRSSQQGPIVGAVAPGWFESMGWGFTTEQQAQFITTLFDSAQGNVGVFIDCGIAHTSSEASPVPVPVPVPETETETDTGDSSNKVLKDSVLNNAQEVSFSQPADHQAALGVRPLFFADGRRVPLVIVPFFGGPDDRQALHLVADLCTHSAVQVLVWRFIKTDLPTDNDIYLDEDRFPAHPAIPQTPAEVHGKGDQPVLKLDLAATRVGDIEEGSKNEADEFYEDNVFISSMLSPCPLNASNARKRDSVASAYAATASSSSAPASPRGLVAEAVAAPPSHQSHHMGSVSVADANADADADVASPVAEPSGTGNGSGGIRQRITQKLRLRSHPSPVAAEEEHENRDNLGDLTASATTTTAGLRGTKFANMTIETIVTTTPLQTMLLRARSLSCSDLIICGRSVRVSMPYFNNEQELAAHTPAGHAHTKIVRQRALGTVAEYLLGFGTDASILVVQTSKNPLGLERFDTNI
ncbi:hypothetical protein LPJ64_000020 [Coemansia asiatica]|uniref:Cation/H+ exchanger transmembrane domain-containing protein n=1 Tax=Coemansia asiatica TaxID=1052880 RepID=A0A9W7XSP1_9FUNG|nr:hypothetical protein LPJ64_000020 [Coemansia asiatica]